MALEEFERDEQSGRDKGYVRMKSIMDYGMGVLWLGMGVFLTFIEKFKTGLEQNFGNPAMKAFGVVCIIYGLFRMYRGYKKNYYRER